MRWSWKCLALERNTQSLLGATTIGHTMNADDQIAAAELLESGTLVEFRVLDVKVQPTEPNKRSR